MFSFFRRPQADPRPIEEVLRTAAAIPESDKEMSVRVWQRVSKKIEAPMFEAVRESLTPSPELQRSVWHRIKSSIEAVSSNVWSDVESELTPSHNMFDVVWQRLVMRLAPTPVPVRRLSPVLRWSASALLLALLIQISPVLFSSQSIASSEVLLTPKKGDVSILIAGLWQPVTDPVVLQESALIQTSNDSEATIVLHDHAVLRLGSSTTIAIHDVSDARSGEAYDPSMTFYRGKLWVQSFLPESLAPLTIGTTEGKVAMQEASISLVEQDEASPLDLRVWSRKATIQRAGETVTMFAGDKVTLVASAVASVQKFADPSQDDPWMRQNLQLDAIHQKEVAALQRQRMVQKAGTLPTAYLYPIKRLAENVDVLLTFNGEARAQKLLDQATTRLNEAAALVAQGDSSAASAPLEEFKQTVLSVASGTGDTMVNALVKQQIAKANADLSAVLPSDTLYALKETVVETSTAVSDVSPVTEDAPAETVDQGRLLLDKLTTLQGVLATPGYDIAAARASYNDLQTEFQELLKQPMALSASEQTDIPQGLYAIDLVLTQEEQARATVIPTLVLSDKQVDAYADRIIRLVFVYHEQRGQMNQLKLALDVLRGNADEGRILRALKKKLTSEQLLRSVDYAIERLRMEVSSTSPEAR